MGTVRKWWLLICWRMLILSRKQSDCHWKHFSRFMRSFQELIWWSWKGQRCKFQLPGLAVFERNSSKLSRLFPMRSLEHSKKLKPESFLKTSFKLWKAQLLTYLIEIHFKTLIVLAMAIKFLEMNSNLYSQYHCRTVLVQPSSKNDKLIDKSHDGLKDGRHKTFIIST